MCEDNLTWDKFSHTSCVYSSFNTVIYDKLVLTDQLNYFKRTSLVLSLFSYWI